MPYLSFKGTTHAYLLKISIAHTENQNNYYIYNYLYKQNIIFTN